MGKGMGKGTELSRKKSRARVREGKTENGKWKEPWRA
jgi:hypothetical protein